MKYYVTKNNGKKEEYVIVTTLQVSWDCPFYCKTVDSKINWTSQI